MLGAHLSLSRSAETEGFERGGVQVENTRTTKTSDEFSKPPLVGLARSICHFAFSLVLQCWGVPRYSDVGKRAQTVSLSHPLLFAPDASKNKDLRAMSPYDRQSTGKTTN